MSSCYNCFDICLVFAIGKSVVNGLSKKHADALYLDSDETLRGASYKFRGLSCWRILSLLFTINVEQVL